MIIECPSCKKKFNIDINLIPAEGRNLQCGSCDHIWFYKKEDPIPETLQVNEDITIQENEDSDKLNDNKSKKRQKTKKSPKLPKMVQKSLKKSLSLSPS